MGYVFDFNDTKAYERWLKKPANAFFRSMEKRLLLEMLRPLPGQTLLDIGCGTGASLQPFLDTGLQGTGLDPSPYMLDLASKNLKQHVDLHRGYAEDLPFEDNSFNYACLIVTLEFVNDPEAAIAEACRVAKDKLFIGILNPHSFKVIQQRILNLFAKNYFSQARYFSIWQLNQMIQSMAENFPITWKTVCHLPSATGSVARNIENFSLIQRCPFGMFAGIVVTLVPRFSTKPLTLRYGTKQQTSGQMSG